MKIPIKLKRDELESLLIFFEDTMRDGDCESRYEAIIATLVYKFYLKLKKLSIGLDKPKVLIQADPETAMAFVEFFAQVKYDNTSFAGNIVNRLISNYDTKTSHFF